MSIGRYLERFLSVVRLHTRILPIEGGLKARVAAIAAWTDRLRERPRITMALSQETIRRIREHVARDPTIAVQLRVGPQQALAMLTYLTASERASLSKLGHRLYEVLIPSGDPKARGPRVASRLGRSLTLLEHRALHRLIDVMHEQPEFAQAMRVMPTHAIASCHRLNGDERLALNALGRENIQTVVEAWRSEQYPTQAIAHLFDPSPSPLPDPGTDETVQWGLLTPLSARVNEGAPDTESVWEAGQARDVVVTRDAGMVIVATDSGGLWWVRENGLADPLPIPLPPVHNDLPAAPPQSHFQCIVRGPDGPDHVYAGGGEERGMLLECIGDLTAWHWILPADIERGDVRRILVMSSMRLIVIATKLAVWFAAIPTGSLPRSYTWRRALDPDGNLVVGDFFGLAEGKMHDGTPTVVVSDTFGGIWVAQNPSATSLRFEDVWLPSKRYDRFGRVTFSSEAMGTTNLASCAANRSVVYASVAGNGNFLVDENNRDDNGDSNLMAILRSDDGGNTWYFMSLDLADTSQNSSLGGSTGTGTTPTVNGGWAGGQGNFGDASNNTIAVSNDDPEFIAVGWRSGVAIKRGASSKWETHGIDSNSQEQTRHLHQDVRGLLFDGTGTQQRLFLCGDAGLKMTPRPWSSDVTHLGWTSAFNIRMANLEFHAPPGNYGLSGSSGADAAVVAGGCQDTGVIFTSLNGQQPWNYLSNESDGHYTFLLPGGLAVFSTGGGPYKQHLGRVDRTDVPSTDPDLLPNGAPNGVQFERVRQPLWRDYRRQLLVAVGFGHSVFRATGDANPDPTELWGMFGTPPDFADLNVRTIANVSLWLDGTGTTITSAASYDGRLVYIGTSNGDIYRVTPDVGLWQRELVQPQTGAAKAAVVRIVSRSRDEMFALFNRQQQNDTLILRHGPGVWAIALALGIRNESLVDIELGAAQDLYVCSKINVWRSRDNGVEFKKIPGTFGRLPDRPNCSNLRLVDSGDGGRVLVLTTFGRSAWAASV